MDSRCPEILRRGTQALLAVYTNCRSHGLNLVIVHSCGQPVIRNMAGTLKEIIFQVFAEAK